MVKISALTSAGALRDCLNLPIDAGADLQPYPVDSGLITARSGMLQCFVALVSHKP